MGKNIILFKPPGKIIAEDIIKNCYDNNSAIFGGICWKEGDKEEIHKASLHTIGAIQNWNQKITEHIAILVFGAKYPIVDATMPFLHHDKDTKEFLYYCHSGPLDIIQSRTQENEDVVLWKFLFEPISLHGKINFIKDLAESKKNGEFLLFSNIIEGGILKLGDWKEENGIFFSNDDYKKKIYVQPEYLRAPSSFSGSSSVQKHQKKKEEEVALLDFYDHKIVPVSLGLNRYFELNGMAMARIEEGRADGILRPMDFITKISGTHYTTFGQLKKSLSDRPKKCKTIHVSIRRFNQIAWSNDRSAASYEDMTIILPVNELIVRKVSDKVLTDGQRNWMITQLVNTMYPEEDTTQKKALGLKMAGLGDENLVLNCELHDINDWEKILN